MTQRICPNRRAVKVFMIFVILPICPGVIVSQSPISLPVNFIDQFNGLHDTRNFFCYQDYKGFIWISSRAGLHRFDGSSVHTYLPDESDSTSIVGKHINGFFSEDPSGNIWFATYDAINCYIRKYDTFRSFKRPGKYHRGYYSCGLDSLGQLWLMHQGELVSFDINTGAFTFRYPMMDGANKAKLVLDSGGRAKMLFAYSTEIRESPGVQVLNLSNPEAIISNIYVDGTGASEVRVKDIYVSPDPVIWVIGHTGLFKLNVQSGEWDKFTFKLKTRDVNFRAIERLDSVTLLVATYADGLLTFNTKTETFDLRYELLHNDLPLDEPPQAIYRDRHGGFWITVGHRGIAYLHPDNLLFRHYRHDLSTPVSTSRIGMNTMLELPDSTVWCSSNKHGAVIFSDERTVRHHYHKHNTQKLKVNSTIMSFQDSRGFIWLLAERGVYLRDPNGNISPVEGDDHLSYESICELNDGRLVLGSRFGGLYVTKFNDNSYTPITKINIDTEKIFTFLKTLHNGLVISSVNQSQIDIFDPSNGFKLIRSIPFLSEIHCVGEAISDTAIWLGSDNGIYTIDTGLKELKKLDWISCLEETIVYGIFESSEDQIWTSTNNGVIYLNPKEQSCQQFGNKYGLCGTIFNRHCAIKKMDGKLWFGNNYGITVIDPGKINPKSIHPGVNVTNILVNDAEKENIICGLTEARNLSEVELFQLPYSENTVSFYFSSVDYGGPLGTRYEYRLRGEDDNWVDAGNKGFARYANLSPGDYTFEARVRGVQDSSSQILMNIIPPIYMRFWFILLSSILLISLIILMVRSWERRKRKIQQLNYERILAVEAERLRIANDMHDDLGSSLSAISLRSKVIAQQIKDPTTMDQMNQLIRSTSDITQQIRDTIWSLNSKHDKVDTLITRLHDYAINYFKNSPIDCSVSLMKEKDDSPIPGNVRRAIYLTFKETLHNIYKHSKASNVTIDMQKQDDGLLLITVKDNGEGFDAGQDNFEGNGLSSIRKRMESVEGGILLYSDNDGTEVQIKYGCNSD